MTSDTNTVNNTLRGISDLQTLLSAVETLESVVYNFAIEGDDCDLLREAIASQIDAYEKGTRILAKALRLMAE